MLAKVKAKGSRGSWFATVEGKSLPCVHVWWTRGIWPAYHDPFERHGKTTTRQIAEFVSAIQDGKTVILTTDKVQLGPGGQVTGFDRDEYVAVWSVDDVTYTAADGLRFRFVEKLRPLE